MTEKAKKYLADILHAIELVEDNFENLKNKVEQIIRTL